MQTVSPAERHWVRKASAWRATFSYFSELRMKMPEQIGPSAPPEARLPTAQPAPNETLATNFARFSRSSTSRAHA